MSSLELRNITKRFRDVTALKNVSFAVQSQEFFVLLGPTGAGKTTTLRVVAALTKQDEGSVLFDGQPVDDLTPADRDVAFVFQQYSLYPTMTVYDNLAFPLRSPMRKVPEDQIKTRIAGVAEILRITHLLDRKTARLSGGEMQRVSIGRAIVRQPRIFLMDEPLSNLDAKLRESLRVELKHMQKEQGNTTLFVTHDQIEALTMADRIGVLSQGRLIQVGTPDEIYDQPATTYVAQLVGTPQINLVKARREDSTLAVANSAMLIPLTGQLAALKGVQEAAEVQIGIRPEDIRPDPQGAFAGEVTLVEPLGVETILHIRSGEQTLLSLIPGMSSLKLHDQVKFSILSDRLHFFGTDGLRLSQ